MLTTPRQARGKSRAFLRDILEFVPQESLGRDSEIVQKPKCIKGVLSQSWCGAWWESIRGALRKQKSCGSLTTVSERKSNWGFICICRAQACWQSSSVPRVAWNGRSPGPQGTLHSADLDGGQIWGIHGFHSLGVTWEGRSLKGMLAWGIAIETAIGENAVLLVASSLHTGPVVHWGPHSDPCWSWSSCHTGRRQKSRLWSHQVVLQTHNFYFTRTNGSYFLQGESLIKDFLKRSMGAVSKGTLRFLLFFLPETTASLKPLACCHGRKGGQCLFNSLLITSAHFSSDAFACENYLPQLPNWSSYVQGERPLSLKLQKTLQEKK